MSTRLLVNVERTEVRNVINTRQVESNASGESRESSNRSVRDEVTGIPERAREVSSSREAAYVP